MYFHITASLKKPCKCSPVSDGDMGKGKVHKHTLLSNEGSRYFRKRLMQTTEPSRVPL